MKFLIQTYFYNDDAGIDEKIFIGIEYPSLQELSKDLEIKADMCVIEYNKNYNKDENYDLNIFNKKFILGDVELNYGFFVEYISEKLCFTKYVPYVKPKYKIYTCDGEFWDNVHDRYKIKTEEK
jgi:hypothetical protein